MLGSGGHELLVVLLGRFLKFRFVSTLHQLPEFLKSQVFTLNCTTEIARWSDILDIRYQQDILVSEPSRLVLQYMEYMDISEIDPPGPEPGLVSIPD